MLLLKARFRVEESPVGYHVLKGGKRRPARGKIQAAHILKMAQGNDSATDSKARHEIDSIYNIVKANPSAFSELATRLSDDRGSARQAGCCHGSVPARWLRNLTPLRSL